MVEEKVFIQLLAQHQNIVHKVCSVYMDFMQDREDLFQEITLQAWKSFHSFKGESKFSTWLYRVSLNTAITYFKKDKKKNSFIEATEIPEIIDQSNSEIEVQIKAMYAAIGELSKIDKALVMLYLEDYDYNTIGEMLGLTANNVAVKMNRIKLKLKERTQKHYELS